MTDRRSGGLLGRLRSRKPEPVEETRGEQRTLALAPLLEWLSRRPKARIVDLGAAHGDNLKFFARYDCRLEFLDLYAQLREAGQSNPAAELERTRRLVEEMLDFGAPQDDSTDASSESDGTSPSRRRPERIDLVLFWDVVNYLTQAQIEGLYRALWPRLASGTRAFLLLAHSPQLPLHPRRLRVASPDLLVWEEPAPATRPCPQYSEHRLHKLFPDFTVERSFLMRHGVREYLLAIPETREQSVVRLPG